MGSILKRNARLLPYAIIIVIICNLQILDAAEASFNFLEEPTNPRRTSMGSAGTALTGGGFSFYNPALPSLLYSSYVSFEYGRLFSDLGRGLVEGVWKTPSFYLGASFQAQTLDFPRTTERGIINGAYGSEQGSVASLLAGFTKNRFSLGLILNGIQHRIAENTSYGVSASVGTIYKLLPGKLHAGAAVIQAGSNTGFLDTVTTWYSGNFPTTIRGGLGWNDTIRQFHYAAAMDVVYSTNFERLMMPIGVEFWVIPSLALRTGVRINHPTEVMSMGIGVKWDNLNFDASFIPSSYEGDVEMKWSMGLTYALRVPKKKTSASVAQSEKKPVVSQEHIINEIPEKTVQEKKSAVNNFKTETDTVAYAPDTVIKKEDDLNVSDSGSIQKNDSSSVDTTQKSSVQQDTVVVSETVLDSVSEKDLPDNNSDTTRVVTGSEKNNLIAPSEKDSSETNELFIRDSSETEVDSLNNAP